MRKFALLLGATSMALTLSACGEVSEEELVEIQSCVDREHTGIYCECYVSEVKKNFSRNDFNAFLRMNIAESEGHYQREYFMSELDMTSRELAIFYNRRDVVMVMAEQHCEAAEVADE